MKNQTTKPGDGAATLLPGENLDPSRRAFLRAAGFGIASSALVGCSRGPTRSIITNAIAPVGTVPGRAYWVATTCEGCAAGCGVLAKCRDGRPVKLEGNPEHGLSRGGLCATGQSEVLSLYDSLRLREPQVDGAPADWARVDEELTARIAEVRRRGGRIRLLTGTIHSPSTLAAIERFAAGDKGFRHVQYDALSVSAILDAHERSHGVRALPSYRFGEADVIASFDADFLGTWISPVEFASGWAVRRRPDDEHPSMSLHVQFEAGMSVTGAAADRRYRLAPWERARAVAALCEAIEGLAGGSGRIHGALEGHRLREPIEELAAELWQAHGKALVVSGSNDRAVQGFVNHANELLGGYGRTLSLARPSLQRRGCDRDVEALQRELANGEVDLLIVSGANPAYDLPSSFAEPLSSAATLVVLSDGLDETSRMAKYRLPASHALESFGDGEPVAGHYSLLQACVPNLHQGRTLRELLARLMGDERADHVLVREHWREHIHPRFGASQEFDAFFGAALERGFVELAAAGDEPRYDAGSLPSAVADEPPGDLGLMLYPKVGLLDGAHAHNPWLQELPDPVTKVTWDNYACLSEERAAALGVSSGDLVRLKVPGLPEALELPVLVQRGQHDDVVAVALGYGRAGTDRFARVGPQWFESSLTVEDGETIGVNLAPSREFRNGNLRGDHLPVEIEVTGESYPLAATQDHHTLEIPHGLAPKGHEVRDAVLTTSLAAYAAGEGLHGEEHHGGEDVNLWPEDHPKPRHHWAMAVDLAACTGCSACVVGCQAENNVPVVGKDEVSRHREMHWIRIDRYLEGEGDGVTAAYQPMFCQQCDNAPCEAVCPVLATVHSTEGLNQQVYNRCVGTRYCANTCPYKVRRFNWFNYPHEDRLQNQQLNPDVTVRTRGVMEKCSFCAQRIQEAKSEAARLGRELADGDILVACQQSCPTNAILFGDLNDPESKVSKWFERRRAYGVLEELNIRPSVRYLARVRNVPEGTPSHGEERHV
ncbi:MAG TPA: 4Fe-4S dicluster domain-containing protein [Planctomycetes bacterium]|nr:4Fe-4S dicluster domain-containing protein [Planctomycetota bacterium]